MLKDRIKEDMKAAFKAGDQAMRGTLLLLLSVIQNREIEKRTKTGESELTDEEVVSAIGSEIKKRKDAVAQYSAAGREDTAATEQAEMEVLMRYMPEQLSEEAVRALITDAIATTGATTAKDLGKVMGMVTQKTKGRFDGARLSALVKEALGA